MSLLADGDHTASPTSMSHPNDSPQGTTPVAHFKRVGIVRSRSFGPQRGRRLEQRLINTFGRRAKSLERTAQPTNGAMTFDFSSPRGEEKTVTEASASPEEGREASNTGRTASPTDPRTVVASMNKDARREFQTDAEIDALSESACDEEEHKSSQDIEKSFSEDTENAVPESSLETEIELDKVSSPAVSSKDATESKEYSQQNDARGGTSTDELSQAVTCSSSFFHQEEEKEIVYVLSDPSPPPVVDQAEEGPDMIEKSCQSLLTSPAYVSEETAEATNMESSTTEHESKNTPSEEDEEIALESSRSSGATASVSENGKYETKENSAANQTPKPALANEECDSEQVSSASPVNENEECETEEESAASPATEPVSVNKQYETEGRSQSLPDPPMVSKNERTPTATGEETSATPVLLPKSRSPSFIDDIALLKGYRSSPLCLPSASSFTEDVAMLRQYRDQDRGGQSANDTSSPRKQPKQEQVVKSPTNTLALLRRTGLLSDQAVERSPRFNSSLSAKSEPSPPYNRRPLFSAVPSSLDRSIGISRHHTKSSNRTSSDPIQDMNAAWESIRAQFNWRKSLDFDNVNERHARSIPRAMAHKRSLSLEDFDQPKTSGESYMRRSQSLESLITTNTSENISSRHNRTHEDVDDFSAGVQGFESTASIGSDDLLLLRRDRTSSLDRTQHGQSPDLDNTVSTFDSSAEQSQETVTENEESLDSNLKRDGTSSLDLSHHGSDSVRSTPSQSLGDEVILTTTSSDGENSPDSSLDRTHHGTSPESGEMDIAAPRNSDEEYDSIPGILTSPCQGIKNTSPASTTDGSNNTNKENEERHETALLKLLETESSIASSVDAQDGSEEIRQKMSEDYIREFKKHIHEMRISGEDDFPKQVHVKEQNLSPNSVSSAQRLLAKYLEATGLDAGIAAVTAARFERQARQEENRSPKSYRVKGDASHTIVPYDRALFLSPKVRGKNSKPENLVPVGLWKEDRKATEDVARTASEEGQESPAEDMDGDLVTESPYLEKRKKLSPVSESINEDIDITLSSAGTRSAVRTLYGRDGYATATGIPCQWVGENDQQGDEPDASPGRLTTQPEINRNSTNKKLATDKRVKLDRIDEEDRPRTARETLVLLFCCLAPKERERESKH